MKKTYILTFTRVYLSMSLCILVSSLSGCKKYLDSKPDQSISTPSTIDDLYGIIYNYNFVNARYPSASEVASDDYYLTTADYNSLTNPQNNYYLWTKYSLNIGDYTAAYNAVEYMNVILDALPKITPATDSQLNNVKGAALFIRASYHFSLSQLYSKPYNSATAGSDLGIAIRNTSNVNVKPKRGSVEDAYTSIIGDLKQALPLLPIKITQKYLPSRPAAWGLLARIYLSMSDFKDAGIYADSALKSYGTLMDYNAISSTATIPFKQFNDEVLYDARTSAPSALLSSRAKVDTVLYGSYQANDLRKAILFRTNANGSKSFKGNYTGLNTAALFTGIATNELYLTRAECYARNGNLSDGAADLNMLLQNRWKKGTFIPLTYNNVSALVNAIIAERRKELPFRSLRWIDLRRLNLSETNKITLTRNINNVVYQLPPNADRYVFAIDQNAVNISGLEQNP
ncbi:RagB/SusD family nutrient uptake outer membrane protein [Mucilaginibacter sp. SJ]|uniref:RagB/SusD family nutrient uptake outer membrane protein n=1 Tax=Mucilaginibacter sp. SJ TaxID=3029053 RepID=UPI0023A9E24B|nr:RagB/SusD family nutrient uptake outer membrane protein [Mucilaginibacter sp. SJ]WEA01750.1 RagB/SusD family nutrient uptake outer membrane protein [Mucilaginibacter sp. SJ]